MLPKQKDKLEKIKNDLKENTIKELDLWGNNFKDEGCKLLCEEIKSNHSLTDLNLSANKITNNSCPSICDMLKNNYTIKKLNLSGNELGNESCRLLAESLKDNFTLQELDITENNITTVGIQYLYEALDKNKTLCSLNLREKTKSKKIDESLKKEVYTKLLKNKKDVFLFQNRKIKPEDIHSNETSMKILTIEQCTIGNDIFNFSLFENLIVLEVLHSNISISIVNSLINWLKFNSTLRVLNLEGNVTIKNEIAQELLNVLSFNFTLVYCCLSNTSVSALLENKIKQKLIENSPLAESQINLICKKHLELTDLISCSEVEKVKVILEKSSLQTLQEVLFICILFTNLPLCEFILNNDLDINYQLDDGNSYLHFAVFTDFLPIIKLLLAKGIETDTVNKRGKSCKDVAKHQALQLFADLKQLKIYALGKDHLIKNDFVNKLLSKKKSSNHQTLETSNYNITQFWAFTGKEFFYSTQPFFSSKNTLHLLFFNLNDSFMEKEIFFWLNLIQYKAPKSKVIIIGTQLESLDPKLIETEILLLSSKIKKTYYSVISQIESSNIIEIVPCFQCENPKLKETYYDEEIWFYPISEKEGWNLQYLETIIAQMNRSIIVRKDVYELIKKIEDLKTHYLLYGKPPILKREDFKAFFPNQYSEPNEIELNVKILQELGFILDVGLEYIVIDPQWISGIFNIPMQLSNEKGTISRNRIVSILQKEFQFKEKKDNIMNKITTLNDEEWNNFEKNTSIYTVALDFLFELMIKFQVCVPEIEINSEPDTIKHDLNMIFPFLSNEEMSEEFASIFNFDLNIDSIEDTKADKEILGREYLFTFLPMGIFEQIFCKVLPFFSANIRFWKNGFGLDLKHSFFLLQLNHDTFSSNSIEIKSTGPLSQHLISAFHFCIKEIFETSYPLAWRHLKIKIKYFSKLIYLSFALNDCLETFKLHEDGLHTVHGDIIPWTKFIPEFVESAIQPIQLKEKIQFVPGRKIQTNKNSETYVCKSLSSSELYSVKVFFTSKVDQKRSSAICEYFLTELIILKNLIHPNIVPLISAHQKGNFWYLAFRFDSTLEEVQTQLSQRIPSRFPKFPLEDQEVEKNYWWNLKQILFCCGEILKGLEYLHSILIAHLDLKPENINVSLSDTMSFQSLKIHHFDNAMKLEEKDKTVSIYAGSTFYMAPEIRNLSPYNPLKADIFSFGILVCYLVANNPKLHDLKKLETLQSHKLGNLILDCLKENPNERPTAETLKNVIQQLQK